MFDQWTIYTPATWVYGRTVIVNAGLSANSLIGTRARLAGTLVTSDQGIIGGRVQVKLSGPVLYAKLNQQTGIWGLQTSAPGTMSCTVGPSGSFTVEALISPVPGLSPAAPDNLPYVYVCLPCAGAFISDVLLLE
jgi:hypothetical protein